MKRMTVICVVFLIAILCLSVFTGCQQTPNDTSDKPTTTASDKTTTTQPTSSNDPMGSPAAIADYGNYQISYTGFCPDYYYLLTERHGKDVVNAWMDENRPANSDSIPLYHLSVKRFNPTKEEFCDALTKNTIPLEVAEAFYNGNNQEVIDRYCVNTQIAFYNEYDKTIYGLRELQNMTKEQAQEKKITKAMVGNLLEAMSATKPRAEEKDGILKVYGLDINIANVRALYQAL